MRLSFAAIRGGRRSFREDALTCVAKLTPSFCSLGMTYVPKTGPGVITINHYTRPGLGAWWLALAASATIPADIHWVVTSSWTFPGRLWAPVMVPLTKWAFRRAADVYCFTTMPPMPPHPGEVQARVLAVRQVLNYARRVECPLIGLAPEGRDFPGGVLGQPPPGAGRFALQLAKIGLMFYPVGVFEQDRRLCLHFGPPYRLQAPQDLSPYERDQYASQIVMNNIAVLLPEHLRGIYSGAIKSFGEEGA